MSINGPTAFDAMVDEIVREVCKDLHSKISTAITGIRLQDEYAMESLKVDHETLKPALTEATERVEELESLIEEAQEDLACMSDSLESAVAGAQDIRNTIDQA